MNAPELVASLGVDTSGLDKAYRSVKQFADSVDKLFAGIAGNAERSSTAIGNLGNAITQLANQSQAAAERMAAAARQIESINKASAGLKDSVATTTTATKSLAASTTALGKATAETNASLKETGKIIVDNNKNLAQGTVNADRFQASLKKIQSTPINKIQPAKQLAFPPQQALLAEAVTSASRQRELGFQPFQTKLPGIRTGGPTSADLFLPSKYVDEFLQKVARIGPAVQSANKEVSNAPKLYSAWGTEIQRVTQGLLPLAGVIEQTGTMVKKTGQLMLPFAEGAREMGRGMKTAIQLMLPWESNAQNAGRAIEYARQQLLPLAKDVRASTGIFGGFGKGLDILGGAMDKLSGGWKGIVEGARNVATSVKSSTSAIVDSRMDLMRAALAAKGYSTESYKIGGSQQSVEKVAKSLKSLAGTAGLTEKQSAALIRQADAMMKAGAAAEAAGNKAAVGTRKVAGATDAMLKGQRPVIGFIRDVAVGMLAYRAILGAINAVTGSIGGAIRANIEYEASLAQLNKVIDVTPDKLQALGQQFRDIAKVIPMPLKELINLGREAAQLGIATQDVTKFVRVMAMLGLTASDLSAEEAANSLARLANIVQMSTDDYEKLASAILMLGNNLATTEGEVVKMGMRLAAEGKQIGLTIPQIMGWAAAMASVGIKSEMGGTAMARVFLDIQKETALTSKRLNDYAKVASLAWDTARQGAMKTGEDFKKAFKQDSNAAVLAFIQGLGKIDKSTGQVILMLQRLGFVNVRTRSTILRLAESGQLLKNALDLSNKGWNDSKYAQERAILLFGTSEAKIKLMNNALNDLGVDLGGVLAPTIKSMTDNVRGLVAAIQHMDKGSNIIRGFVGSMELLIAIVAGGALLKMLGQLKSFGVILRGIPSLLMAGSWAEFSTTLTGIGAAAAGAATKMGLFGKAVLVAATALEAYIWWNIAKKIDELGNTEEKVKGNLDELQKFNDRRAELLRQMGAKVPERPPIPLTNLGIMKVQFTTLDSLVKREEDYSATLQKTGRDLMASRPEWQKYTAGLKDQRDAWDEIKTGLEGVDSTELEQLIKRTEEAAFPAEHLAAEFEQLKAAKIDVDTIMFAWGDNFLKAVEKQKSQGGALSGLATAWERTAKQFTTIHVPDEIKDWIAQVKEFNAPMREYTKDIEDLRAAFDSLQAPDIWTPELESEFKKWQSAIDFISRAQRATPRELVQGGLTQRERKNYLEELRNRQSILDKAKDYANLMDSIHQATLRDRGAALKLEQEIVNAMVGGTEDERRAIERRKVDLEFELRQYEMMNDLEKERTAFQKQLRTAVLPKGVAEASEALMNRALDEREQTEKEGLERLRQQRLLQLDIENHQRDVDALAEIKLQTERATTREQLRQLNIQQEILGMAVAYNVEEARELELVRINLDDQIRKQEALLHYQEESAALTKRIGQMATGTKEYADAMQGLRDLAKEYQEQVDESTLRHVANLVRYHRTLYLGMIEAIRDGAGQAFDYMLRRGKSVFQNLMDWIKDFFIGRLRVMFQNLMESLFAPAAAQGGWWQQVMRGVIPYVAQPAGQSVLPQSIKKGAQTGALVKVHDNEAILNREQTGYFTKWLKLVSSGDTDTAMKAMVYISMAPELKEERAAWGRLLLQQAQVMAPAGGGQVGYTSAVPHLMEDLTKTGFFKEWFGATRGVQRKLRLPIFTTPDKYIADEYADRAGWGEFHRKHGYANPKMLGLDTSKHPFGTGKTYSVGVQVEKPLVINSEEDLKEVMNVLDKVGIQYNYISSKMNKWGWQFEVPEISKWSPYEGSNPADIAYIPKVREELVRRGYDSIRQYGEMAGTETLETTLIKSLDQLKFLGMGPVLSPESKQLSGYLEEAASKFNKLNDSLKKMDWLGAAALQFNPVDVFNREIIRRAPEFSNSIKKFTDSLKDGYEKMQLIESPESIIPDWSALSKEFQKEILDSKHNQEALESKLMGYGGMSGSLTNLMKQQGLPNYVYEAVKKLQAVLPEGKGELAAETLVATSQKEYEKLLSRWKGTKWEDVATTTTGVYERDLNRIVVKVGESEKVFNQVVNKFQSKVDYLASVLGHEIEHTYDWIVRKPKNYQTTSELNAEAAERLLDKYLNTGRTGASAWGGESATQLERDLMARRLGAGPEEIVSPEELRKMAELFGDDVSRTVSVAVGKEFPKVVNPHLTEFFDKAIAEVQRGAPEMAMVRVQNAAGGGVLSHAVEHTGDLTHRMTEYVTAESAGFEYVKYKVDQVLKSLNSQYGFVREMNENIVSNAEFRGVDVDKFRKGIDAALKSYAQEHAKIPVFNPVQAAARNAAISLGMKDFELAKLNLEFLQKQLSKGAEHWARVARTVDETFLKAHGINAEWLNIPKGPQAKIISEAFSSGQLRQVQNAEDFKRGFIGPKGEFYNMMKDWHPGFVQKWTTTGVANPGKIAVGSETFPGYIPALQQENLIRSMGNMGKGGPYSYTELTHRPNEQQLSSLRELSKRGDFTWEYQGGGKYLGGDTWSEFVHALPEMTDQVTAAAEATKKLSRAVEGPMTKIEASAFAKGYIEKVKFPEEFNSGYLGPKGEYYNLTSKWQGMGGTHAGFVQEFTTAGKQLTDGLKRGEDFNAALAMQQEKLIRMVQPNLAEIYNAPTRQQVGSMKALADQFSGEFMYEFTDSLKKKNAAELISGAYWSEFVKDIPKMGGGVGAAIAPFSLFGGGGGTGGAGGTGGGTNIFSGQPFTLFPGGQTPAGFGQSQGGQVEGEPFKVFVEVIDDANKQVSTLVDKTSALSDTIGGPTGGGLIGGFRGLLAMPAAVVTAMTNVAEEFAKSAVSPIVGGPTGQQGFLNPLAWSGYGETNYAGMVPSGPTMSGGKFTGGWTPQAAAYAGITPAQASKLSKGLMGSSFGKSLMGFLTGGGTGNLMGPVSMGVGLGAMVPGGVLGKGLGMLGGGLGMFGAGSAAMTYMGAQGMVGGYLGGMSGFIGDMMGAIINPITGIVAGAIIAGLLAYKFAKGPTTQQAAAKEVGRDFGVNIGKETIDSFISGFMPTKQAWGIRKDILSSPKFLSEVAGPTAKAQGTYNSFLRSLENVTTSFGTFNFRKAFELGSATGDWTELNTQFAEAFQNSKELQKVLPNWKDVLAAGAGSMQTALDKLIQSWTEFRQSILDSIPTAKTMFDQFLQDGTITDELRNQVTELGGDIADFEEMSRLTKLNNKFEDLKNTFMETGVITQELRDIFNEFGGDIGALESAGAQLKSLKKVQTDIGNLKSGLEGLIPSLDPIQQFLQGEVNQQVIQALTAMGLDVGRMTAISPMIKAQSTWDNAVNDFFSGISKKWDDVYQRWIDVPKGLVKGGVVEQMLNQYGGVSGRLAVSRYYRGANTISQGLLEQTKAAMDQQYQEDVKGLLEYVGVAEEGVQKSIDAVNATVTNLFATVGENLGKKLDAAKQAVCEQLGLIIQALTPKTNTINTNTNTNPYTNPKYDPDTGEYIGDRHGIQDIGRVPSGQLGGLVLATGLAKIHKGEILSGVGKGSFFGDLIAKITETMKPRSGRDYGGAPSYSQGGTPHLGSGWMGVLNTLATASAGGYDRGRGPTIVVNNVYGWNDFVEQVRKAGIDLRRRGN